MQDHALALSGAREMYWVNEYIERANEEFRQNTQRTGAVISESVQRFVPREAIVWALLGAGVAWQLEREKVA